MQSLAIIGISIASAIVYGILHDMITVRLCAEYFTVAHPNILRTEDPNELALFWGIVATWWVGLGLGVGLACIARIGQMPKRTARSLVRPIMKLMAGSAVGATLAGCIGYVASHLKWIELAPPWSQDISAERHDFFFADAFAHSASYLFGAVGGIVLMVQVWRSRQRATEQRITLSLES